MGQERSGWAGAASGGPEFFFQGFGVHEEGFGGLRGVKPGVDGGGSAKEAGGLARAVGLGGEASHPGEEFEPDFAVEFGEDVFGVDGGDQFLVGGVRFGEEGVEGGIGAAEDAGALDVEVFGVGAGAAKFEGGHPEATLEALEEAHEGASHGTVFGGAVAVDVCEGLGEEVFGLVELAEPHVDDGELVAKIEEGPAGAELFFEAAGFPEVVLGLVELAQVDGDDALVEEGVGDGDLVAHAFEGFDGGVEVLVGPFVAAGEEVEDAEAVVGGADVEGDP